MGSLRGDPLGIDYSCNFVRLSRAHMGIESG